MQNICSADFEYQIIDNVVVIYDLNKGGLSVTNDIENVLSKIQPFIKNIDVKRIIYKDSQGIFDEIITDKKGNFLDFKSLNQKTLFEAIETVKKEIFP